MPYPEIMIKPMREDLTRLGVEELRTAQAVDETVSNSKGTLMLVVNSICGCAAGKARRGLQ
jgi:putative YphP/YqiW family bacilliredoxin